MNLPELRVEFAPTLLAAPFLALLALVVPPVFLSVLRRDRIAQLPLLALFAASMAAVVLARSVAAFALSWECMALVSAVLVGTHYERRAVRRALFSYLIAGQIGAACIVSALVLLGIHAQSMLFADIARSAPTLPGDVRLAVALLALIGFGSKAGLLPLQFWLPRAHPAAPAAASALLSGAMLKMAVYGLLLVACSLAAPLTAQAGAAIAIAGLLTALFGALSAAVESDLKRLLAFSSIENLGIIAGTIGFAVIASASGAKTLAAFALGAALFHVFAHGIFKSALFLGAGEIAQVARTTDIEHLGGLLGTMRFSAPAIFAACLAAASLPPLCGFASEWLLLQTMLRSLLDAPVPVQIAGALALVCIAAAGGIAAIAFVKAFGAGMLGAPRSAHPRAPERFGAAPLALMWLAALALLLGALPAIALRPLLATASAALGLSAAPATPSVPVWIAAFPVAAGIGALVLARVRGVRVVPAWTCGSPVTLRSQYTAAAFANPLRLLFEPFTRPYLDDMARNLAAAVQRAARGARVLQAGYLRVYLVYALAALVAALVAAQ